MILVLSERFSRDKSLSYKAIGFMPCSSGIQPCSHLIIGRWILIIGNSIPVHPEWVVVILPQSASLGP